MAVTITPAVGTPTAITVAAGSAEPTCQVTNATTTYSTTAANSTGLNWSLSNPNAGSINSAGVVTWANGFSGSVNIQVTANGCNGPSTQVVRTVTINAQPTVNVTGTASFCSGGGSTTLTANATPGSGTISSYQWYKDGNIINNSNTGSGNPTREPSYVVTVADSYTVVVTNTNGCSVTSAAVNVTANPAPTAANAGADQTIGGTSTTLTANAPTVGTGTWSIISGTGGSIATTTSPTSTFTGTAGSTYTLRWTTTSGTCTSTDDVVVAFNQIGTATTASNATTVYGAVSVALSATVSPNPGSGAVDFYINGSKVGAAPVGAGGVATYTYNPSALNASGATTSYIIKASFLGVGYYTASSSDPGSNGVLTVNKATTSLALGTSTFTYDGAAKPVLVSTTPAGLSGVSLTYGGAAAAPTAAGTYALVASLNNPNYTASNATGTLTISKAAATIAFSNTTATYDGAAKAVTATTTPANLGGVAVTYTQNGAAVPNPTNAGSYQVSATLSNPNYALATSPATGAFTINKAAATLALTTADLSQTYSGSAKTVGVITSPANLTGVSVTYNGSAAAPTVVGTYPVVASLTNDNYEASPASGTLTIGKAVAPVALADLSQTYNGTARAATATTTAAGASSFTYTYDGKATAPTNAGQYVVVATLVNDNFAGSASGTLVVAPKELTVTADNQTKTYGDANPALTVSYSGFVGTEGTSALTTAPTATTTATQASGFGTYPITASGGVAPNYSFKYVAGTLSIGKAELTVAAAAASREYGEANPAFTATVTGQKNGDTFTTGGSSSAMLTSPVGNSYVITPSVSGSNLSSYTVKPVDGTLTITPARLTVTADNQTRVYGEANPAFTGTITGQKNNESFSFAASTTATTGSPISSANVSYAIQPSATGTTASNYTVEVVNGVLTITARSIIVTADAQSKTYGDSDPALTYKLTSGTLVGANDLTGSLSRATGENVGAYAINQNTLSAGPNYSLTYNGANLSIGARAVTVTPKASQTKTYGAADPALAYEQVPLVGTDAFTGSLSREPGSSVGAYNITQGSLTLNANYLLSFTPNVKFTITTKQLTASITASNKVYDGTTVATATGSVPAPDVVAGDALSVTATGAAFDTKQVGTGKTVTATVALGGPAAANYTLAAPTASTTASITKRPLTIALGAASKVYNGSRTAVVSATLAAATATSGLVSGDEVTVSASNGLFDTKDVGTGKAVGADVSISGGADAGNYAANATASATADITPVQLTPRIVASSKSYDGTTTATLSSQTVTGMVNGETAVGLTVAAADFDTKNQGTGKTVTATGLRLTGAAAGNYSLAPNATATALANITPAVLTYTATPASRPYGAANGPLSGTITGFASPETAATATTGTLSFTSDANATSPVGTYAITGTGLTANDGNYTFAQAASNATALTVSKATPTVTAVAATNLVYSGTPKAGSGSATGVGGSADGLSPAVTLSYSGTSGTTYGPLAAAPTNAGSYTVTASFAGNSNYSAGTSAPVAFTISPAALTVTTVAASKIYGEANPGFSVTYAGFVNNEGPTALGGTLTFTTTATAASPVGSYDVTPGGLTSSNYVLSFAKGTLTSTLR